MEISILNPCRNELKISTHENDLNWSLKKRMNERRLMKKRNIQRKNIFNSVMRYCRNDLHGEGMVT
jgi:hypothetical protein